MPGLARMPPMAWCARFGGCGGRRRDCEVVFRPVSVKNPTKFFGDASPATTPPCVSKGVDGDDDDDFLASATYVIFLKASPWSQKSKNPNLLFLLLGLILFLSTVLFQP